MGLNSKQQAFAIEYAKDFNATQAAIRAGYSEKTAYSQGQRLLKNVEVAAKIQTHLGERAMSANEVLARLAEQARAEHSQFFTDAGDVDIPAIIKAGKAHLIKSIKNTPHGLNVEFHDTQAALSLLGRHHKLFIDRHEHTGKDGEPLAITIVKENRGDNAG